MSFMKRTIFALFIATVLLSSACVIAVQDPDSRGKFWPKGTFRKNLDLKPGGAVSLENGDGDIEIYGWKDDKINISAEGSQEAPRSAGIYFIGSRSSPPDVNIKGTGNSVRIRTRGNGYENQGEVVHYFLQVPHSVNLDSIRNGRGRITVSDIYGRALLDADEGEVKINNYSGSLDVRLGSGSVEAEVLDFRPQDSVRIKVESGDIILRLEPDVSAQIIAEAPAGDILSELELGQPLPAQKVSAKLGNGQASIELTALRGDIRLRKVEKTP
jgi:hypothetical protein